jgi:putative ABC transport system permease protein
LLPIGNPQWAVGNSAMRRLIYEIIEAFRIAFAQIRANKLRSALTALGVIIGIVAVSLMVTAVIGINTGVEKSLSGFGSDVFYVTKWPWHDVEDWWNYRNRRPILTTYARQINDWAAAHPEGPIKLAVPAQSRMRSVKRGDLRVYGIFTLGTSADLPRIGRADVRAGRFFNDVENRQGTDVAVIGFDVADALFRDEDPVGQSVLVGGRNYRVIGVMARQGSFLGMFSWDSMVAVPITSFRRNFSADDYGEVRVQVDPARFDEARNELRGLLRRIRAVAPEKADDFEINEQATIREQLDPIKKTVAYAGLGITGLALFVGAIGIMNITFVSVKERTREIGTRKALGARRRTILLQFLIEAVSISLVGGVIGLTLTWGLTGLVAAAAPTLPVVFSPLVLLLGVGISVLTGVFSGFAPAWTASGLDPVEALRYE